MRLFIKYVDIARPVIITALLCLFINLSIQSLIRFVIPDFSILANKGLGKIILSITTIICLFFFALSRDKNFFYRWKQQIFFKLLTKESLLFFSYYFIIFFSIHILIISWGVLNNIISVLYPITQFSIYNYVKIMFGFIATFFLAYTEEFFFRGTLFYYLNDKITQHIAVIITSTCFMLAHNIANPLLLITNEYQLGIGLFLIGYLLNYIFIYTQSLSASMGAHAGLVFVKVIIRRIPLLTYHTIPWWFNKDLRQAPLCHLLLLAACLSLKKIVTKKSGQK